MKTSQKLELYTGLIIQPVLLFYLILSLTIVGLNKSIEPIFILWLLSLLITFGAYYHTKKESLFGFWMTFIGGVIVTFLSGFLAFFFLYWGGGILFLAAALIPLILSSAAAVFAVSSLK